MISEEKREELDRYGQAHILRFYEQLSDAEKEILENQIEKIDFKAIEGLYRQICAKEEEKPSRITPIPCAVESSWTNAQRQKYYRRGIEIMRQGKYAAVTMAGGQGTRLGHNGPKGTFVVCVPEQKSLFEIQCGRLKARAEECGRTIPWYIMTSEENDEATKRFFRENDYFGYPKESVLFFRQYMLPMLTPDGKLILEEKYKIREGADGHGGIFKAMLKRGVIADMRRRGVEWIFTGGIDNILVRPADPCFLGYLAENGYALGGKSILKRDAFEKAGVFCKKNQKPFVIEYTEISPEMAEQTNEAGEYVYGDAHILCNLFQISVFEKMGAEGLPYHAAYKKAAFIEDSGNKTVPEQPNAYKFEAFIFDAFAFYDEMGILRVEREREFAPIKNKAGEDSPETAQKLYISDAKEHKQR
ncbi:MAG: UTP--glucose-1-phosphate uridylyltransferase [Clostridia bacterium]